MESLFFLIPLSLLFFAAAVGLFFWAVNSGQYDDVDREGERILYDEGEPVDRQLPVKSSRMDDSGEEDSGERGDG